MNELGIIVIAVLTTVIVLWIPMCHLIVKLVENMVRNSNTVMRERDKERHDAMHFVSQFAEKLTGDPKWLDELHARERHFQRGLDTSLDRDEIRRSGNGPQPQSPATPPDAQNADGVRAQTLEEAIQ